MKPKVVVSVFDGYAGGRVALHRAGIPVEKYYAYEIDKYAIQVTQKNWPDIIQMGDVREASFFGLPQVDILMGGSPCQGFSFAGKGLNFEDPRSKLFFEFVRLKHELAPKYFFLENVNMKKEYQDAISKLLGVEPIKVNSALVSAQNRVRLYWTNIPGFKMPEDRSILLGDILIDKVDQLYHVRTDKHLAYINKRLNKGYTSISPEKALTLLTRDYTNWNGTYVKTYKDGRVKRNQKKGACLTGGGNSGGNHSDMDIIVTKECLRRLTPVECERLQTVPDGYTEGVSNTQRYKMLGNGWNVDTIVEFFKHIK